MDINELVKEFADCVAAQEAALAAADPVRGNQFARRYVIAFEKLRSFEDEGRDALAGLLDDQRAEVRVMAASHLLGHCGEKAIAVLEEEARGKGRVAFGAAQALLRWKDGTWALDPKTKS